MANKARSRDVINFQKQQMCQAALEIIVNDGYGNLSIRKLSKRLQVSPSTIYNYFKNREEIYIYVLNRGFEMLFDEFRNAYDAHTKPVDKLKAVCNTFLSFSVRERNLTFIMLILDTPKYYDYVKTDYEADMKIELHNALRCRDLIAQTITEIADANPLFPREDIPYQTFSIITRMIGLATIRNNNLGEYLTSDMESITEKLLTDIIHPFEMVD
jgi:AcrR family transcriptional regulator